MSTRGTGNTDGERHGATADGAGHSGDDPTELMDTGQGRAGASSAGGTNADHGASNYVPGAYSPDDDTSDDYVPGMYSGNSDTRGDATPTREHTQPISASRDAPTAHEQSPATQVVPVTATQRPEADQDRERRLPRAAATGTTGSGVPTMEDRKLLHQREKEHFGGMKFGAAFFGWLTATGMFVLLSALAGTVAAVFGFGANLSASDVMNGSSEAQATGITTAIILGSILLIAYFTGGYVAGRMARFSGAKQGVAVWLWAVTVAIVLAIIGLILGNQANVTERFSGLGLPSWQDLTGPGLIGLLVVAAVALIGAILGGLAGMRYHRRIDRADFDALDETA